MTPIYTRWPKEAQRVLNIPSAASSMRRLGLSRFFVFYETAGVVKVFCLRICFLSWGFLSLCFARVFEDSSRASIRTRSEPLWARCLMGPDGDELGLLSKARPVTARPPSAVTQTRD